MLQLKKISGFVIKWLVAVGMIFFIVRSGKIDFQKIYKLFEDPAFIIPAFLAFAFLATVSFYRWKILLEKVEVRLKLSSAIHFGMIGVFFNAFIPGLVSGDIIKSMYVIKSFPKKKLSIFLIALIDRIIGLLGLIILGAAAFTFALFQSGLSSQPAVIQVIGMGLVIISIMGVVFILKINFFSELLQKLLLPVKKNWAEKIIQILQLSSSMREAFIKSIFLSLVIHMINAAILYSVAVWLSGPAPWGGLTVTSFLVGSVIGLCVMAIPISPMGIGTGQLAFAEIFKNMAAGDFGANIITAYQIIALMLNATGVLFFLFKPSDYKEDLNASTT